VPLVNVMVNQRAYTIACDAGEEEHLRELARHVDAKVRELLESVGQVGDTRLLLMAALLISDDYIDAAAQLDQKERQLSELSTGQDDALAALQKNEDTAANALAQAAKRVSDIAAKLAEA
jgi:cell division protein ZapA